MLGERRVRLSEWSTERFPNNRDRIEEIKRILAQEQNKDPLEANIGLENRLITKKRAHVKWLQEGDMDTSFFLFFFPRQTAFQRRATNKI